MSTISGLPVIIAGGATGLGATTAKLLGRHGAKVVVGDLNFKQAKQVAEEITSMGGTATPAEFDLSQEQTIEALINNGSEGLGGLDGLINMGAALNPAHLDKDVPIDGMDADTWRRTMDVNLIGFALTFKYALPHFMRNGSGNIVNISAALTFLGEPVHPAYAASKAGVHTLTRHVARTWGPQNIRANAVTFGHIETEVFAKVLATSSYLQDIIRGLPIQRAAKPEEAASLILHLLSKDASYVTSQVWSMNGGMALRE